MNEATKRYFAVKDVEAKGFRGKMVPKRFMRRNVGPYRLELATSADGGAGSIKLTLTRQSDGEVVGVRREAVDNWREAEAEFYTAYRLVTT